LRYKLIEGSANDINDIVGTVLRNRGVEKPQEYLNLTDSCVGDYNDLDNIDKAVECFVEHYNNKDKIAIIPDEDADGYTSSAMLYLYIKSLDANYPIEYILHDQPKQHGLVDIDLSKFDDAKLIIIADASTNDAAQCNELITKGKSVIVLDHHDANYAEESEEEIDYQAAQYNNAIIVNNQLSDNYSNKDLSGAGIVYRFLQALDQELWHDYANNLLDLCAVGNIADVMDLRSQETRYFANCGLKNFHNKFLQALATAQEYSTKGIINIHNISWFFAPIINSVTRMGSYEERDILFRAMTEQYEEFDYKKRDGSVIKENIYDRAVRLSKNIKSRQDKQRDIVFNELIDSADISDKVVILESKKAQSGLVGLSAMKLADTLKRAVIVVKEIEKDGVKVLSGSCRNFDGSPILDFKELILQTGAFEFCSGHGNAAGLGILPENLEAAKVKFKEILQDVDFNLPILCDFEMDFADMDIRFIMDVAQYDWLWCTGIKEPKVAVTNISVQRRGIKVQGKDMNSIAFEVEGVKYVAFKLKEDNPLLAFANGWGDPEDELVFDAVVTCGVNTYHGISQCQCMIEDVEVKTIQND
jgi:single-stranded-DNA-specific exonuclease